ncbi:MAG: ribosome maturation factor RimP [Alphaproteobacteria bacterium]|nr:ribosome maturation factor RimP [Alphaproteobacteria bacterium]
MELSERISELIEPSLGDMGYELVRVRLTGSQRKTLQIMADRIDGAGMSVEDCADISHAVSALLDVDDPIPGAYSLEVSSPGIDRPLTRLAHFERFAGFDAKIELHAMLDGRKRYSGRINGVAGEAVRLALAEGGSADLPYSEIRSAKLIMNDALMAAAQNGTLPGAPIADGADEEIEETAGEDA